MMCWVCLAALIHEMGHVVICRLLGGKIEVLTLSLVGAEMKLTYPIVQSYGRENLVLISGAVFNLLTGVLALAVNANWLAMVSFGLGAFNLLPIIPLDGGRILFNLISEWSDLECGDRVISIVSGIFVGLIMGFGCIMAVKYANALLFGVSLWLLLGIIKKKHNFMPNK